MDDDSTHKKLTISLFCLSNAWYEYLHLGLGVFLKTEFFLDLTAGSGIIDLMDGNKYVFVAVAIIIIASTSTATTTTTTMNNIFGNKFYVASETDRHTYFESLIA